MRTIRLKIGNDLYKITRMPSIFTNRNDKEDCYIAKQCKGTVLHGARDPDNMLFNCIARLACENGEVLRTYEVLPGEISNEFLKQQGFID